VEDHRGNAYRAAYVAKLRRAVYVLHVFQKKSTRGVATPRRHLELIRQRLQAAKRLDAEDRRETHQ
jgi:phage-related protein